MSDALPAGITSARAIADDRSDDVQAVVIGTGAGGSIALRELARAGIEAIAIEEGSDRSSRDFDQREDSMLPELFQDRGGRTTDDYAITVLQGRGVGGSTIHNTNLCKRTPPEILDRWARACGVVGCTAAEMESAFATIERDLEVKTIDPLAVNANNQILRRGIEALGWRGGVLSHNRTGCVGSGFCELGCAYDAKNNARKTVLPQAIAAGGRVLCDARAVRVMHDGSQVRGVLVHTAAGGRLTLRSKIVVLAGSAVGSAALAIASGLPDPHAQLGRKLRLHPGAAIAGVFDEDVDGWRGVPQSWECTEHLDFGEGSDRRVWITTVFAHPIGTASAMPGFGAAHMSRMRGFRNLAVLTAMVHDGSEGTVYLSRSDGRPAMRYRLDDADRDQLAKGVRACAKILLAAGARRVIVPSVSPIVVTSERDLDAVDAELGRPHRMPLTAVHPMGSLRMGEDDKTAVVKSTGEHHQVKGLFVADGSLFPTSLGGPPQISIYAFALHLAPHMIDAARK
jgi:choline dehydrogenase-like flavoprotein